ncbi:MAG: DUF1640 domain-containing protein [Magnetococcales bacterium]|nr:DUF1640 domain-containing protein [Magnetococcales bacterium]NGZ26491.1 DUF1640 domain-containing protein [Magnetococcales bacterium]
MATIAFDTLKFTRTLRASGISEAQAEAIAQAFKEAQGEADLVTKLDLQLAVAELRTDIIKWMVSLAMGQVALLIGILLKIS